MLRLKGDSLGVLNRLAFSGYKEQVLSNSWQSIPILNEWRCYFPDQDAVKTHQQIWGQELCAVDGSSYQWDEELQSFVSINFGPPGATINADHAIPEPLKNMDSVDMGLTFENTGLSGSIRLRRK